MANKNNIYRRQTKAYQRNVYKTQHVTEEQNKRIKYLSMSGIIAPAVVMLISIFIKSKPMFFFSLVIWVICIAVIFINASRRQRKFVRDLKEAGMPRNEYIRQMKKRTKSKMQLEKYIKVWDLTKIPDKKSKK